MRESAAERRYLINSHITGKPEVDFPIADTYDRKVLKSLGSLLPHKHANAARGASNHASFAITD